MNKKLLILFFLMNVSIFCREKVFFARGLFYEYYQIKEALTLAGIKEVVESSFRTIQGGKELNPPFPEELDSFKLIILANVDSECLSVFDRKNLADFVENGGCLLVTGGLYSLGKGKLDGTFIRDILPVDIVSCWDIKSQLSLIKPVKEREGIDWDEEIYVRYYQEVRLKPEAEVWIKCDSQPLVVWGSYGKGKVCVVTATPLGEYPSDKKPFFASGVWKNIMKMLIKELVN